MAAEFLQTQRALRRDGFGPGAVAIAAAVIALGAWLAWFVLAEVTVVVTTTVARLERVDPARPIESPVAGRIAATHLTLGQQVAAGEVLFQLDATELELELAETRAHLQALAGERATVAEQQRAEQTRLAQGQRASTSGRAERAAELRAREAGLALAREQLRTAGALHAAGAAPDADLIRARTDAARLEAEVEALRHGAGRHAAEDDMRDAGGHVELEQLAQTAARLDGEIMIQTARAARLAHQVELRTVRAPVDAEVASVENLAAGAVVRQGDVLAVLLPAGRVRIIAHFPPQTALGRLRPGQRASMRLDGFPWTQHGVLPARVAAIAAETRHGRVRVELEVLPDPPASIPLQHGLPGSVEVIVETTSPATLALRAAGAYLGQAR